MLPNSIVGEILLCVEHYHFIFGVNFCFLNFWTHVINFTYWAWKTGRNASWIMKYYHNCSFHLDQICVAGSVRVMVNFVSRVNFVSWVKFGSCRVNPLRVRVMFVSRFEVVFVSRVVFGLGKKKIDTALTQHELDTWQELPPLVWSYLFHNCIRPKTLFLLRIYNETIKRWLLESIWGHD